MNIPQHMLHEAAVRVAGRMSGRVVLYIGPIERNADRLPVVHVDVLGPGEPLRLYLGADQHSIVDRIEDAYHFDSNWLSRSECDRGAALATNLAKEVSLLLDLPYEPVLRVYEGIR